MERIKRKFRYYLTWYLEMTTEQQNGFIGQWVNERITIFSGLITNNEVNILN